MSGLIWNAVGQSVGNAATSVGNYMMRDAELDERRAYERERDAMYRRTADQQAAGRGASGPRELTDVEQAAIAGMSKPEYDAYWNSVRTGDRSAFKREVTRYGRDEGTLDGENDQYSDAVSRKNATLTEEKVAEYPPGFEREYQAKVAKLAEIRKMSVYNKDYDDVKKGEQTGFQTDVGRSILNGQIAQGEGAGAIAGMKGEGGYKVQGNTVVNEFTGTTRSTEVGESIEERNRRPPAAKGSDAATGKAAPAERLSAQAETLRKAINDSTGERKRELERQFDEVMRELRARRQNGGSQASAAPRTSGVTKGGSKYTLISE